MDIKIFCPHWGMKEDEWEKKLQRIKEAGFDGVEMGAPKLKADCKKVKSLLVEYGLSVIAQQWTAGNTLREHMESLEEQTQRNVLLSPLFINSQTGKDHFEFEDNLELLHFSNAMTKKYDVKIHHETHRGRFAFAAHITSKYLDALPDLTLTADFSHWCCVSESYLADQTVHLEKAINKAIHIHARVGYPEGPQVTDPRAKEWEHALQSHLVWWDKILSNNHKNHFGVQTITPEFGPIGSGYLHTLPFTNLPVADQWDINCHMKEMLKARFLNLIF